MISSARKWLQQMEAGAILHMRPVFQLHDQMSLQLIGCPKEQTCMAALRQYTKLC